jgi:uncharacterized protein DUF3455
MDVSANDTATRRRRRSRLAGSVVAAALALGGAMATTTAAQAAPPPDAGAELRAAGIGGPAAIPNPGPGFRVRAVYKVTSGTQTYTCAAGADGTAAWGPGSTPEAQLRRYLSRDRIHHFGGPRWQSERDGSTLVGVLPPAQSVPKPGTIPWLLLEVTHEGPAGELDPVTHISRIRTSGGVAPTRPCTPGEREAVPYGADYVFWAPR